MGKPVLWDFDGWFSILLPEGWETAEKEGVLTFFARKNGKGALQISLMRRTENIPPVSEFVMDKLERFLSQNSINYDINTKKVIEGPYFAFANASGFSKDNYFHEVWALANHAKFLLITYISPRETKESKIAENIVYSIQLH